MAYSVLQQQQEDPGAGKEQFLGGLIESLGSQYLNNIQKKQETQQRLALQKEQEDAFGRKLELEAKYDPAKFTFMNLRRKMESGVPLTEREQQWRDSLAGIEVQQAIPEGFVAKEAKIGDVTYQNQTLLDETSNKETQKTKQQEFLNTSRLRKEFVSLPEVKDYVNIQTQLGAMEGILKDVVSGKTKNLNASDQYLITTFNKIGDPTSVVRESEYLRTEQGLPLANKFIGAYNKILKGGTGVTNDDRQAIIDAARVISAERGKRYNERYSEYEDLSSEYGLNPKHVTRGMGQFEQQTEQQDTQGNDWSTLGLDIQ
jgi:hypothetical protein